MNRTTNEFNRKANQRIKNLFILPTFVVIIVMNKEVETLINEKKLNKLKSFLYFNGSFQRL